MERRQVSSEAIDQAIKTAKEQADEALLEAAANPEANPDYIKQDIRFKVDTPEETANFIKRLKAGAFAVGNGSALQGGGENLFFSGPNPSRILRIHIEKLKPFSGKIQKLYGKHWHW